MTKTRGKLITRVIAAVFIYSVVLLSIIPIKVSAFEDYWSDFADTSWYEGHEADTEYTITTAEQLAGIYDLSHGIDSVDFVGKTISLGADIDLSGRNWCTIDTFKGVFDGKGHSISNMTGVSPVADGKPSCVGLFRIVTDAEIRNLSLLNCNIINDEFGACGVAAQASNSMITNSTVTGVFSGISSGGIVGQATLSTIKNCIVNANISGHLVSMATPETAGDEGVVEGGSCIFF